MSHHRGACYDSYRNQRDFDTGRHSRKENDRDFDSRRYDRDYDSRRNNRRDDDRDYDTRRNGRRDDDRDYDSRQNYRRDDDRESDYRRYNQRDNDWNSKSWENNLSSRSTERDERWRSKSWQHDDDDRESSRRNGRDRREGGSVLLVSVAGKRAREEDEDGTSAKLRLVQQRGSLSESQVQLCQGLAKEHNRRQDWPSERDLPGDMLEDVRMILDNDYWDGQYTGKTWVLDWLKEGDEWGRHLVEGLSDDSPYWCRACWQAFDSETQLYKHMASSSHVKRQKNWVWKFGLEPAQVSKSAGSAIVKSSSSTSIPVKDDDKEQLRAEILGPTPVRKGKASDMLASALQIRSTPAAVAKKRLLEWRNGLPAAKRREVLSKIGHARANDIPSLSALSQIFEESIAKSLDDVRDTNWIFKEPTFSWLSGFYWHPEATSLQQKGPLHGPEYCHLCETDCPNFSDHSLTKKHAEHSLQWAEQMGALDHPSHCSRCRKEKDCYDEPMDNRGWNEPFWLDLQHWRSENKPDVQLEPETTPPMGFQSVYTRSKGRVRSIPYLAFSISQCDNRIKEMRVLSQRLKIGPRENIKKKDKRSFINCFWCRDEWQTLAIPCKAEECRTGDKVDFSVQIRWGTDKKDAWEEIGWWEVEVPEAGEVALHRCRYDWRDTRGSNPWLKWVDRVDCTPIFDFVSDGQVQASGGIDELRGTQRPFQFATEDEILSFFMYVPPDYKKESARPQLLMFFHGDMARGLQQCEQPGLANFCDIYGPALMVKDPKKETHTCRSFVVITPSCPEEYWWLRHPATHDSTGYVTSMETCLRRLVEWTQSIGVCDPNRGICLAGQSMGAYMALEFARACPDLTQAVLAGAPCFDAFRLEHLARRLVNVPLWLLIGRNDSLCSFEEVASLALMMRDLDAKCVRLTSYGIKGHSEVGAKLEHKRVYEWLLDPLNRGWCSS